jgi:hypothetical protein
VQVVAGGLACLFLAIALAQLHPFTPTQVVVALIVTAAARFLVPLFATDQSLLTIVPWVMLGCVIAVVLAIRGPRLKPFFGFFERLLYLSSFVWLFVVAIDLARISG